MQFFLRLKQGTNEILLEMPEASRGAAIAGLRQTMNSVEMKAWDEDERGRVWDKQI